LPAVVRSSGEAPFTKATGGNLRVDHARRLEAPPGFEPGMEVLQTARGCDS
jgi:hypothetical protein